METTGSHCWFSSGDRNSRGTLQSGAETYGIVFYATEAASSQEHICISGAISSSYLIKRETMESATKAFITWISPESYCVRILLISPFCSFHQPPQFATPLNLQTASCEFPGWGCWLLSENAVEECSSVIIDLKHLACRLLFTAHMAIICWCS